MSEDLGKVDQLYCWYKGTRVRGQEAEEVKGQESKDQRTKEELA